MMEFIRARWKLVGGGGVPREPACPGVGKHGPEQKQKRNKSVSRPDPNDAIHPGNVLMKKPAPH